VTYLDLYCSEQFIDLKTIYKAVDITIQCLIDALVPLVVHSAIAATAEVRLWVFS